MKPQQKAKKIADRRINKGMNKHEWNKIYLYWINKLNKKF
jgi:hypothetical protein